MKVCNICQELKDLTEFHKNGKNTFKPCCKKCRISPKLTLEQRKIYNLKRKERAKSDPNYREKRNAQRRKYLENNKEKVKIANKEAYIRGGKRRRKQMYESVKKRKQNDPLFRLRCSLSSRLSGILNKKSLIKNSSLVLIIGCSLEELKIYLESKFQEGMSWDNYGLTGWHVDHIIPVSSAKNEEEIYKLNHYTNLQPLWAEDNLKKSNKIE